MMQQLRESTKIIMILVAVSFVALMVFDWAMDISGRSAQGSSTAIGSVNGREIPLADYETTYGNLVDRAREEAPDATVTDDRLVQLQDEAWDRLVNQALLDEEAERRGIRVTDREVLDYIKTTPPPEMRESPAFQTDGAFDPAKYQQALADPQLASTWALYEGEIRRQLPLSRLQEQVLAGVTVTDHELEDAYRAVNEQVRVQYLYLDPTLLVPDSAVPVSEDEIRKRYEERKEEFRRLPLARVSLVTWTAHTTAADTARVKAEIDSLHARAVAGEDFAELAAEASQDPASAQRGGDLGWFGRGQMVPEFEQAAFGTPPGEISATFLSPYGWHVLKVNEREADSTGVQRVRASHILLRVEPSEETFAALEDSAAALRDRLAAKPDSFVEAARAAGREVETTPPFEQSAFVPSLGRAPDVADWVFENPAGSISEPLRAGSSVVLVKVEGRTPAGFTPLGEVRDEIRRALLLEKKLAKVQPLEPGVTQLVRERGLAAAADSLGLKVAAAGPFARSAEMPQIGGGNAFIGTAFALKPGATAGPIELENGIYYLTVTERVPADMTALEEQREGFRQQLLTQKSQQVLQEWLRAVREAAKVEDFRDEFLRAAESDTLPEEPPAPPPIF